mmetsp:Transcript_12377/g.20205  ORF Transcript_12377/g.20205 Transcript_12377/m.20205 type:complete len:90 (-) Transcript_12377:563-832(-)
MYQAVELKNIGAEVKAKMLLTIGREESAKWDASCATLPVNSQPNKGMSTTAIQEPCHMPTAQIASAMITHMTEKNTQGFILCEQLFSLK